MDSFIKETLRFEGTTACVYFPRTLLIYLTSLLDSVQRKTVKDVTLCDGTFLPQGTRVVDAAYAIGHDHHNYENPFTFESFRFVDLKGKRGDPSKYQFTSVSHDLTCGWFRETGLVSTYVYRHRTSPTLFPSPGRFLAFMTLKALLAYNVVTYDLMPGKDFPDSQHLAGVILTRPSAKLLFRKRMD